MSDLVHIGLLVSEMNMNCENLTRWTPSDGKFCENLTRWTPPDGKFCENLTRWTPPDGKFSP